MSNGLNHITENQKREIEKLRAGIHHTPIVSAKSLAYIPIGHGSENISEEMEVPEGCVLVVKGHAGEVTWNNDFKTNLLHLLDKKNRSILLDPNNKQKELFSLLTDRGNNTVAIYNEKDKLHNFTYSLLNLDVSSAGFIDNSGILKINSEYTSPPEIIETVNIRNFKVAAFSVSNSVFSINTIGGLNIYDYFTYSNIYPYYYTRQHIKDIMEAVTELANNLENLKLDRTDFNKRYAKLEKDNDSVDILGMYIYYLQLCVRVPEDSIETSVFLEMLGEFTLKHILDFISSRTKTTQSILFDDVRKGIIQPGVFYNLVCRATGNTDTKGKRFGFLKRNVNAQGKEVFPTHITNIKEEVKEGILEAEKYRKGQVKLVEPILKVKNSKNFTLKVNKTPTWYLEEYISALREEALNTQEYTNSKKDFDKQIDNLEELPIMKTEVYARLIQKRIELLNDIERFKGYILNDESKITNTFVKAKIEDEKKVEIVNKILDKHFKDFVPIARRKSEAVPFETRNYKKYEKNSKNANSYTYKKEKNGKWQRYKKWLIFNTKNVPKPVNATRGVIETTQNNRNYVRDQVKNKNGKLVNGKWKTRKWNTVAQKYVEENLYNTLYKNNSALKNAKPVDSGGTD